MLGTVLVLAGGVLQVGGIYVTDRGAGATWREFSPNENLSAAIRKNIAESLSSKWLRIRAVFGYPTPLRLSSKNQGPMITIGGSGRLSGGQYRELDADLTTQEALKVLDQRSRALHLSLDSIASRYSRGSKQSRHRMKALEKGLSNSVDQLVTQDRRIAIGGIQSILGGLLLVGLGVILQTASVLVPTA